VHRLAEACIAPVVVVAAKRARRFFTNLASDAILR
jgi:hypothetical protein